VSAVIEVTDLRKSYGDVAAVDGVSFEVRQGEIFGMVGPNGAGKTTTIECIEGLRRPDEGSVRLLSMDPARDLRPVAERIGIQLQESALPPRMRAEEALRLFGSFHEHQAEAAGLLDRMGLADKRRAPFSKLSGGQKQRLLIALALVNQPEVVFFDELTTGLDPQARRSMWELVTQIRDSGCTVVLTTHFMEEAERLCDRVLIMDHGRILALDTPDALIRSLGAERRLVLTFPPGKTPPSLGHLPTVRRMEQVGDRLIVYGGGERFVGGVVSALEDAGVDLIDLRTEESTLEEVFLALTGREMRA
jgi:ABC-2 type transport system ATP-binding protein